MGSVQSRMQLQAAAYANLRQLGVVHASGGADDKSARWIQTHFLPGLGEAAMGAAQVWQNKVYLRALRHADPYVRQGIRTVMGHVFTAGFERGRTVFGLFCEVRLPRPEVVGEFDHYAPMEQWVANRLRVSVNAVRIRHSSMFAPAHAGLMCLLPSLQLLTVPKVAGTTPNSKTRAVDKEEFKTQSRLFLVSVSCSEPLELDNLDPGEPQPEFELPYYGVESDRADSIATVLPEEAVQAFDGIEMLTFWPHLHRAAALVDAWRADPALLPEVADVQRIRHFPLEVTLRPAVGQRMVPEQVVWVRPCGSAFIAVALYQGPDAEFFVPQLSRLGVALSSDSKD